jgi:hypothetical protein
LETISDNPNNKQFAKLCKNGCGKLIKWDTSQNTYSEVDTNKQHRCPTWNPNHRQISRNLDHRITQEQLLYMDTLGPTIAEILSVVQNLEKIVKQLVTHEKSEEHAEDEY